MSECLQYPDFTVVACYRDLVIGCGFLVPDVRVNEAYISFLLVHPDWRGGGIGAIMLYHLIQVPARRAHGPCAISMLMLTLMGTRQTCMGKDVTLHVSATNPAMLLYQRFGFKPEQFMMDFYARYYAADSTECPHAFRMRLRR